MISTRHAQARCRQRAISNDAIDVLWDYGAVGHRHGADIFYLNRRGKDLARRALGQRLYARLEAQLDSYLVVSGEGLLITAGRRTRRMKF